MTPSNPVSLVRVAEVAQGKIHDDSAASVRPFGEPCEPCEPFSQSQHENTKRYTHMCKEWRKGSNPSRASRNRMTTRKSVVSLDRKPHETLTETHQGTDTPKSATQQRNEDGK